MTCTHQHHFEGSSDHEYNIMGVIFPYGSEGFHTCCCGLKWKEAPDLSIFPEIEVGGMVHKILGSTNPIESFKNKLITPNHYGKIDWEWANQGV